MFSIFNIIIMATARYLFKHGYIISKLLSVKSANKAAIISKAHSNTNKLILSFFIVSPLEQFEVSSNFKKICVNADLGSDIGSNFNYFWNFFDISSVSESIFYIAVFISVCFYFYSKNLKFYPYSIFQLFIENLIVQIRNFVMQSAGFANQPMVIFFSVLTFSLLIFNISGMIPFAFAITSHFVTTFFYSFSLFFGINYIGVIRHEISFLNIFLPRGTPTFLLPLMVALEFISYFSRLFSLGIRLFANIMAGHALLSIFTSFAFKGIANGGFSAIVSFWGVIILFIIILMEVAIALLQVFVFVTLATLYVIDVHSVNHLN